MHAIKAGQTWESGNTLQMIEGNGSSNTFTVFPVAVLPAIRPKRSRIMTAAEIRKMLQTDGYVLSRKKIMVVSNG
jgi:hypothetical protein